MWRRISEATSQCRSSPACVRPPARHSSASLLGVKRICHALLDKLEALVTSLWGNPWEKFKVNSFPFQSPIIDRWKRASDERSSEEKRCWKSARDHLNVLVCEEAKKKVGKMRKSKSRSLIGTKFFARSRRSAAEKYFSLRKARSECEKYGSGDQMWLFRTLITCSHRDLRFPTTHSMSMILLHACSHAGCMRVLTVSSSRRVFWTEGKRLRHGVRRSLQFFSTFTAQRRWYAR